MKNFIGAFAVLLSIALTGEAAGRGKLYGAVVVIDPGHGGKDPGSHGLFTGDEVWEDEYAYDVALRVRDFIKKEDGVAFLTIEDPNGKVPRDWVPSKVFPPDHDEVFSLDRTQVRARTAGLSRRLQYANSIKRRYPKHRVVFVAIHFDVVGKRTDVAGVQIIAARQDSALAHALVESFHERMRQERPLEVIGEGARNLYI